MNSVAYVLTLASNLLMARNTSIIEMIVRNEYLWYNTNERLTMGIFPFISANIKKKT